MVEKQCCLFLLDNLIWRGWDTPPQSANWLGSWLVDIPDFFHWIPAWAVFVSRISEELRLQKTRECTYSWSRSIPIRPFALTLTTSVLPPYPKNAHQSGCAFGGGNILFIRKQPAIDSLRTVSAAWPTKRCRSRYEVFVATSSSMVGRINEWMAETHGVPNLN